MAEKYKYKDTEVVNFEDILPEVKKHLSEEAYDLFINSDNNMYLGDDGIIYEFSRTITAEFSVVSTLTNSSLSKLS